MRSQRKSGPPRVTFSLSFNRIALSHPSSRSCLGKSLGNKSTHTLPNLDHLTDPCPYRSWPLEPPTKSVYGSFETKNLLTGGPKAKPSCLETLLMPVSGLLWISCRRPCQSDRPIRFQCFPIKDKAPRKRSRTPKLLARCSRASVPRTFLQSSKRSSEFDTSGPP
jgi:hypothetical protein